MNSRYRAELRNLAARGMLARQGEILPETDRRIRGGHGRGGDATGPCSPSSEHPCIAVPLTADDLTPGERTIYDDLWAKVDVSFATVDAVEHFALLARNQARSRGVA